ncbi:hypothetical protein D9758_007481 [Tetrapyrgos nigripes]|uniref:Uncharacterized protein n=1 Tax=Tetrapyrgos nigripes TaxID=182062 RepID=A0A8H5G3K9_9AGAR|nr:hypothetical protein D9758_007481 [Tetrapyrgos nigripes]
MTKPTLLQTLLGQPSQSYSFPKEKDYHSTKSHLRRVAAEAQQAARPNTELIRNCAITSLSGRKDELMGRTQVRELNEGVIIYSSSINSQHDNTNGPDDARGDHEHRFQDGEDGSHGEQDSLSQDEGEEQEDDDDNDIFYTPNTTPRSSMAGSGVVYPTPTRKRVLNESSTSSSTPFDARSTISSSTTTSISDTHSIFSTDSSPVSDSTKVTSPYNSESGHDAEPKSTTRRQHATSSRSRRETATRANTERAKRNSSSYTDEDWAKDVRWLVSPDISQKSDSSTKSKKRRSESSSTSSSASSSHSPAHSPSSPSSHSPSSSYYITPIRSPNQPTHTKTTTKQKRKSILSHNPSIMMSMTALLEEDEDAYIIKNSAVRGRTSSTPDTTTGAGDLVPSSPTKSTSSNSTRRQSSATNTKSNLVRRRSRSLEDIHLSAGKRNSLLLDNDIDADVSSQPSAFASSKGGLGPYAPSLPSHGTPGYTSLTLPRAPPPAFAQGTSSNKRASILGDVIGVGIGEGKVDLTRSGMAQTTMATVEVVKGLGSVSASGPLRNPFAFLGFGKQQGRGAGVDDLSRRKQSSLGFTSWRKPPNYVPGNSVLVQVWAVGADGVDARLAGVSLGRGAESEIHNGVVDLKKLGHSRSASTSAGGRKGLKPWHRKGSSNDSLPSSASSSPSSTVRSPKSIKVSKSGNGSKTKMEPPEVGYIPGRSFVGRVLEIGWEVSEDAVRKGEWVVGLLDVRKGGALQEFIVVDRHKVYRVPHPTIPSSTGLVDPTDASADQDQVSGPSPSKDKGKGMETSPKLAATLGSLTLNHPQHQSSSLSRYPVPTPYSSSSPSPLSSRSPSPSSFRSNSIRTPNGRPKPNLNLSLKPNPLPPPPTLQELALIPICGVPAYRAVRTILNAFASSSSTSSNGPSHSPSHSYAYSSPLMHNWALDQLNGDQRRRKALILRGHDGIGAMAVQMLVRRGWRVCVHAPIPVNVISSGSGSAGQPSSNGSGSGPGSEAEQKYMAAVEERMRRWGAEEVIFDDGMFSGGYLHGIGSSQDDASVNGVMIDNDGDDEGRGAIVRVIERLIGDGDVFDAVLDTVGGKEIWEASERLLRNMGSGLDGAAVPSAEGVRGLGAKSEKEKKGLGRIGSIRKKEKEKEKKTKDKRKSESPEHIHRAEKGRGQFTTLFGDTPSRVIPTAGDHFRAGLRSMKNNHREDEQDGSDKGKSKGNVGKPGYAWVSIAQDVDWDGEDVRETIGAVMKMVLNEGVKPWVGDLSRIVPFERTPELFVEGGPFVDGGTAVVKIVE